MNIINSIINRIFFRWTKWEIHKENIPYIETKYNPVTGWNSKPNNVTVDIYVRTNLYTGLKEYKNVIKLK